MTHNRLGYSSEDLAQSPNARFYNPVIGPLQPQVAEALLIGPQADELFPPASAAGSLAEPGYWPVETGYARKDCLRSESLNFIRPDERQSAFRSAKGEK